MLPSCLPRPICAGTGTRAARRSSPQLPPLVGRTWEEKQAELLSQVRQWFDESNQEAIDNLSARADLARGIV